MLTLSCFSVTSRTLKRKNRSMEVRRRSNAHCCLVSSTHWRKQRMMGLTHMQIFQAFANCSQSMICALQECSVYKQIWEANQAK